MRITSKVVAAGLILLGTPVAGWVSNTNHRSNKAALALAMTNEETEDQNDSNAQGKRVTAKRWNLWPTVAASTAALTTTLVLCPAPEICHAASTMLEESLTTTTSVIISANGNDLYKPNPLTNGVLEQIRIWEQAEADNIRYQGELERGDAGNKGQTEAYPRLLLPLLQIANDLGRVQELAQTAAAAATTPTNAAAALNEMRSILQQSKYDKIEFKKSFNAYGDNIYYSDPDRANLYLGGGATPKSEQSIAYLLRNEILNNIEDLRAEVDFLVKQVDEPRDDLLLYSRKAYDAMKQYLEVVPPNELERAKSLM